MKNLRKDIIFDTFALNRSISLTETQWKHIKFRHPEMSDKLDDIRETVERPSTIRKQSGNVIKCYKYLKPEKCYIMVAVKVLNGDGFILTSYLTRLVR